MSLRACELRLRANATPSGSRIEHYAFRGRCPRLLSCALAGRESQRSRDSSGPLGADPSNRQPRWGWRLDGLCDPRVKTGGYSWLAAVGACHIPFIPRDRHSRLAPRSSVHRQSTLRKTGFKTLFRSLFSHPSRSPVDEPQRVVRNPGWGFTRVPLPNLPVPKNPPEPGHRRVAHSKTGLGPRQAAPTEPVFRGNHPSPPR